MSQENTSTLDNIIQLSTDKTLIAEGPLADQCAKALHQIYAKEKDKETGMVLESQANDVMAQQGLWEAASSLRSDAANTGKSVGMIYAVQKSEVAPTDIINVTDSFTKMSPTEKDNSVIFIDEKVEEDGIETTSNTNVWEVTLEDIAQKLNIKVIKNLNEIKL